MQEVTDKIIGSSTLNPIVINSAPQKKSMTSNNDIKTYHSQSPKISIPKTNLSSTTTTNSLNSLTTRIPIHHLSPLNSTATGPKKTSDVINEFRGLRVSKIRAVEQAREFDERSYSNGVVVDVDGGGRGGGLSVAIDDDDNNDNNDDQNESLNSSTSSQSSPAPSYYSDKGSISSNMIRKSMQFRGDNKDGCEDTFEGKGKVITSLGKSGHVDPTVSLDMSGFGWKGV
jgi:hypothetical protein